MPREHCFEGYNSKSTVRTIKLKATSDVKRCMDCQSWANYYGNTKDFWCKHRKHLAKNYKYE